MARDTYFDIQSDDSGISGGVFDTFIMLLLLSWVYNYFNNCFLFFSTVLCASYFLLYFLLTKNLLYYAIFSVLACWLSIFNIFSRYCS